MFATCSPTYYNDEVGGFPIPLSLDKSKSAMFSSELPQENGQSGNDVVTLIDESGRRLNCSIEHSLEVEGSEYLLLMPVDPSRNCCLGRGRRGRLSRRYSPRRRC
jgi:hypothetical protein